MFEKNIFQIFLCDPEHLNYNLTERAEVFEKSRGHFVQDYSDYNYKIYFNEELEQEILDFDPELHKVYNNILPYAYRADIGRYVLLYRYGGWYFDLNAEPKFYIEPKKDILLWKNKIDRDCGNVIENRIIYSHPDQKLFSICLEKIIENYKNINYSRNALAVTGPGLIKDCYDNLSELEKNNIELHRYDYDKLQFMYEELVFNTNKYKHGKIDTLGLDYLNLKGTNNYAILYKDKKIYQYTVPKITSKTEKELSLNSSIPRIIHQTWNTNTVPEKIFKNYHSWIFHNPDYEHKFYNDLDIIDYVDKFNCNDFEFSRSDLLATFNSNISESSKVDIFRYCVLYQDGGIYADINSICFKSLSSFIPNDADCVILINASFQQQPHHVFAKWFLSFKPGCKIIKDTLTLAIKSCLTKNPVISFGINCNYGDLYTGSAVYNEIIFNHFNFKKHKIGYISNLPTDRSVIQKNIKNYFIFSNHNTTCLN